MHGGESFHLHTSLSNGFNGGVSGAITGAGGVSKNGAGTLTLDNGANSFAGLTINLGRVDVTSAGAIGGGGVDFVNGTAQVVLEPDEELHLMHGSFECMISWLFARAPNYYDYISHCDQLPMYQHLYRQMQYLQWQDGGARGRPWIMKSPVHIHALPELLATFPDAVLVHCHRDLQKVLPSFASLIEEARKIASDQVDPKVVGAEMFEYWAVALDRYLIAREQLPADRIMDVPFEEVVGDIVEVISRIYARAGRALTPEAIAAFRDYDRTRPEHHWGTYSYSAASYGYTPELIDNRFAAYRERFIKSGRVPVQESARA